MRLVAAALAALLVAAAPAAAQNAPLTLQPGETLLEVQAEGVHLSRPDVMTITAGVVTTAATAPEAMQANNSLATRLIERVRALGVNPRDIRTQRLSLRPRFDEQQRAAADRDDREPRIIGYIASNDLELRLRDLSRAGEILAALIDAGANSVRGPQFSLSQPRPADLAAQQDAIRIARENADSYAQALGMRVARVLRVSERSRYSDGRDGTITVTGSRNSRTPIEPGEISTRSQTWVDFALVPR